MSGKFGVSVISTLTLVLLVFSSFIGGSEPNIDDYNIITLSSTYDDPILIEGDSAFNASNGISSGSGILSDPYILQNRTIQVTDVNGIQILNTTAHLLIRNCTLIGPSSNLISGISIQNGSNITLHKVNISNIYKGLFGLETSHIGIHETRVDNCTKGMVFRRSNNVSLDRSILDQNGFGFFAQTVKDLYLQNSHLHNNNNHAIEFNVVTSAEIIGNLILGNNIGLFLTGRSEDIELHNNSICNNTGDGIILRDRFYDLKVRGNDVSHNGREGIIAEGVSGTNIVISENNIGDNCGHGIVIDGDNVQIISNMISNNMKIGVGISTFSYNNIVFNNTIDRNSQFGVAIIGESSFNEVRSNIISHNSHGVYLIQNSENNIVENEIFGNDVDGIWLSTWGDDNQIKWNNIHDNKDSGIKIDTAGQYNEIFNNSFHSNLRSDIELSGQYTRYNRILNNSFHGDSPDALLLDIAPDTDIISNYFFNANTAVSFRSCLRADIWNNYFENTLMEYNDQADDEITWNRWSRLDEINVIDGPYIYGNYWSDYSGVDIDGDGIGDTNLPHGPGDKGPIIKEIPPPDITPPTLMDLTIQGPETGRTFNASFLVQDDRILYEMEVNMEMSCYSFRWGQESNDCIEEFQLSEDGLLNLSLDVDSKADYLVIDANLTDFSGNMANFSFNYTVEDVIPPRILGTYWEEKARTGEEFTIKFTIYDNIGIVDSSMEYVIDGKNDPVILNPLPQSTGLCYPIFNISVGEDYENILFRLHMNDINGLGRLSEWYYVDTIDVTPPSIKDITEKPPMSNMDYQMSFSIGDNHEVHSIEMIAKFDKDTVMEREVRLMKYGPFNNVWEVNIPVPETSYWMIYTVTIWDRLRNENVLSDELEVIDSVLPEVLDLTAKDPVTQEDHLLQFSISDNEGISGGFFEYWYDDGPRFNDSELNNDVRIDDIPPDALMLNYRAGARDLDGNWRIIQRSVEIEDGTLPSIDIQYKTPFTSRPFKVWVVATDNREVWETSLKYSIDGDSAQISALFPGPYYEIELPPEATTITLYGSARDGNRNENISRVVLEVLDGTPPVVEFSNLEIGQDGSISLFFTCEDNRELARIWVILIGEDDHAHNVSMDPVEGINQVITFSKKGLGGEFNYTIYAMDAQGNVVSTDARTIVLPVDGSGSTSYIWIVLLLIAILIVLAVAVFTVYYKRSRSEENQVEIEKIKEVFDHFEVGTRRKDMDCYKVLGVPNSATVQEITKSYRELALVHHPDMIGNGASVDDAEMKRINCAKAILIDPEKRAILDRYLGSR